MLRHHHMVMRRDLLVAECLRPVALEEHTLPEQLNGLGGHDNG